MLSVLRTPPGGRSEFLFQNPEADRNVDQYRNYEAGAVSSFFRILRRPTPNEESLYAALAQ
jgi:hypothetical protein